MIRGQSGAAPGGAHLHTRVERVSHRVRTLRRGRGVAVLLGGLGVLSGSPAAAHAQGEGGLRGTVIDAVTRAPIAGARIAVLPGVRGAITDGLGRFAIRELRPGVYRVEVRAPGYAMDRRDSVQVLGDQTAVLAFVLRSQAVLLEGIVVAERPDVVLDPRVVATEHTVTAQDLRQLPVTTIEEAVALQPGVVGNSYRGGRAGEDLYIVDGMGFKNQLDAAGGTLGARIPPAAVEQATVVTNGFSARYGQALSGMVSVVTRDGPERPEARLTYETDRPLGDGADYGLDRIVATVGTPLVGRARFLAVVDGTARLDADPVNAPAPQDPLDPRAARPWLLPHNAGEQLDFFAKLTVPFGSRHLLRVLGTASDQRRLLFDPALKYALDRGPAEQTRGRLGFVHYQMASSPDSTNATIVDLRLGYFTKEALRAPLLALPSYTFGAFSLGGFDFAGADIARARDSVAAEQAVPGFTTPELATATPWGVPAFFYTDSPRGELAWNRFREGRARLDAYFGRGHDTDIRVGGEYVAQQVETFTRLEAFRPVAAGAPPARRSAFSPFSAAGYGELVHRWEDLTLTFGIRGDAFDARGAGQDALGGTRFTLSPRFAVSTALRNATVVASFGRFAQAPDFQYLVDAAFDDTLRTGRFRRGNPQLGFETATQYELRTRLRTSRHVALQIGAYVKRIDGLVASVPVGFDPDSAIFGNADYGTVRGIDATIEREAFDGLAVRVSYVLQDARATATNALDFYRRLRISPVGDTIIPAVVDFPLDYDQRHSIIAVVQGETPPAAPALLRGVEGGVVARWGSGLPYSQTNATGDTILGLPNSHRLPSQFQLDARLGKRFALGHLAVRAYVDVRNLTDRRNVVAVRRDNDVPQATDQQIAAAAQQAYAAHPEAIPYESPRYRPEADLDHNGVIAGSGELLPLYLRAAWDFLQPVFAYGAPRLFRLGVEVGF